MERLTFTVEEAAKVLGIGRGTAYEGVRTGQIPSITVGRRRLVPRAALLKLLEEPSGGSENEDPPSRLLGGS